MEIRGIGKIQSDLMVRKKKRKGKIGNGGAKGVRGDFLCAVKIE